MSETRDGDFKEKEAQEPIEASLRGARITGHKPMTEYSQAAGSGEEESEKESRREADARLRTPAPFC
jgi:hypothetical protein